MNNKFLIHIAEPSKFLDSALNLFEEIAPTKNIVFLAKRDEKFEVLEVDESKIFFKAENKKKYEIGRTNTGARILDCDKVQVMIGYCVTR